MLNSVNLTGRLTVVPELKTTNSGTSVVTFSVAVQRNYKDAEGKYPTDFINCVAWRSVADFISRNFTKGQLITVEGSLQTRSYETKNGEKRTAVEVIVERPHFCGDKKESSTPTPAVQFDEPPAESSDDELPF